MQKNKNSQSLQMTYFSNTTSIAQGKLIILFKNKVHTVSFGVFFKSWNDNSQSKMYVIISLTLIIKITAQIQLLCGINSLHTANFFPSHEGILIKALKYLFHNCNEFFKPSKNQGLHAQWQSLCIFIWIDMLQLEYIMIFFSHKLLKL